MISRHLKTRATSVRPAILVICCSIIVAHVLAVAAASDLLDFRIFYEAGRRVLSGRSPYDWYGPHRLPFQSFPWLAYLVLPLSLLPIDVAWLVFVVLNLTLLVVIVVRLQRCLGYRLQPLQSAALCSAALLMNLLLLRVGQVTMLQLSAIVMMMLLIDAEHPALAGLAFPIVLIKPHLVLLVAPALLWRGGRATFGVSIGTTAILAALATAEFPTWPNDLVRIAAAGQARNDFLVWNFTTLPALLGLPRQWNYAGSLVLLPLGAFAAWKIRALPAVAWLSAVLALSLLAAPYSFAYDLPLLLPALLWLTPSWSSRTIALWAAAAGIPALTAYSSGAYLVTVLISILVLVRVRRSVITSTPSTATLE